MDTKATTLLAKLFGNDGRTIPYRPEVAKAVGGIGAAILLQQIVYRANGKNFEPFYKFKEPCGHHLYQEGDSWTEELGFNRREFDNAISEIGVKHTAKVTMEQALEIAQRQHKPVLYWTNASRVTFYRVEIPILVQVLADAYDQKCDSDFSKSTIPTLDQKYDSDFIKAEITTRSPKEKEPPAAAPSSDSDIDDIAASFKTPPPRQKRTTEQAKAGIRHALEEHARNGNGKAGVADPTVDPWEDKPVRAWCAFIRLPYEEQSPGRKRMLATDLQHIATDGGDKAPDDVYEAIKAMTQSPSCEWMRSAGRPTHSGFAETLINVLCGQVLPEGGNGGASTGRTTTGGQVQGNGFRAMPQVARR